jgi:hypothetical protein
MVFWLASYLLRHVSLKLLYKAWKIISQDIYKKMSYIVGYCARFKHSRLFYAPTLIFLQ